MILQQEYIPFEINRGMLLHSTPIRNFVYGIVLYLFIFFIAPVTIQAEYDFSSVSYVICSSLAFLYGGLFFSPSSTISHEIPMISAKQLKKIVIILFWLSVIGVIAKSIDTFFIRGLSSSMNAFENREASTDGSANPIAIIAAFFMYAPYLLLTVLFLFEENFNLLEKIIIWFLFLCQLLYPLLMGSRSGVMFPFLFLVVLLFYSKKIKFRFSFRLLCLTIVIFAIGCVVAGKMFKERTMLQNRNLHVAYTTIGTGAAATVPANDTAFSMILEADDIPLLEYFLVGYVNFCQYYLHGIFEFPGQKNYVDHILQGEHTNGFYMFQIYMKFINKIFPADVPDMREAFVRPGIFCSVWGPVYTDFGWWGILVMFFWGLFQKFIWHKTFITGNFILLPWVFLGGMIIFLFPLLNLFPGTFCYAFSFSVAMYFLLPLKMIYRTPENTSLGLVQPEQKSDAFAMNMGEEI